MCLLVQLEDWLSGMVEIVFDLTLYIILCTILDDLVLGQIARHCRRLSEAPSLLLVRVSRFYCLQRPRVDRRRVGFVPCSPGSSSAFICSRKKQTASEYYSCII